MPAPGVTTPEGTEEGAQEELGVWAKVQAQHGVPAAGHSAALLSLRLLLQLTTHFTVAMRRASGAERV